MSPARQGTPVADRVATTRSGPGRPGRGRSLAAAAVLVVVLVLLLAASVLVGSRPVPPDRIPGLLLGTADADLLALVHEVRIPRTIAAALVGAALAWAGTLMQAMTRNPLAEPGILGVGSGAAFAVTIALSWLGVHSALGIAMASVLGAAVMTVVVLALGLRGSADGSRLILAGVAFSMTISGVQLGITLLDPRALDAMRAWSAGSLATPDPAVLTISLPLLAVGATIALLLRRPLDALSLGDDLARSLGSHPLRTRGGVAVAAALLVGAATAIAGPIGFVGLIVPHLVRPFTGPGTARVLLVSTFVGAALTLAADIVARIALWPGELPVGVVTAAIGAPILLLIIRGRR
ncbi:iron ABC transporter permease [Leucobacter allii]|uniref:FecCD family ABC transporter permease n=1 Tax=Leucobacter allii TaxID=2932247 RepID=UPI001FD46899|nr:iron ABC transporter permease [Leucobacter allii]UOR02439.1 iron ABC transporter permease [Leucobacter allii]